MIGWTARGGSAILDQGLFAGGNFVLSLVLARWLTPEGYGAYALAWSVFLLLAAFHTALVTEPMLVFAQGRYAGVFRRYLGTLMSGSSIATLAPALLLAATGWWLQMRGDAVLSRTFYALAVMAPCVLLLWLVRRAFYALMNPAWAAAGGSVYLVMILGGAAALFTADALSPAAALLVMAGASLIAATLLAAVLRPSLGEAEPATRSVVEQHWGYGRWASATTVLTWLPSNMYYVLLPAGWGLEGAGALKAVMNLLMPVFHASLAVAVLLVPTFVRSLRTGGMTSLRAHVTRALGIFVSAALLYGIVLALAGERVFDLVYAGRYAKSASLVLYVLPFPATAAVVAVLGGALRALERPDLVFRCYLVATVAAAGAGLPLLVAYGVAGSLLGLLASSTATALAMGWYWVRVGQPAEEAA